MGSHTLAATLYLALMFTSLVCSAHNTFTMGGRNRWKAGGKRSDPAMLAQQNFLDPATYSDEKADDTNNITLRDMLVDMRDYCDFLLKLLDNVRMASESPERK